MRNTIGNGYWVDCLHDCHLVFSSTLVTLEDRMTYLYDWPWPILKVKLRKVTNGQIWRQKVISWQQQQSLSFYITLLTRNIHLDFFGGSEHLLQALEGQGHQILWPLEGHVLGKVFYVFQLTLDLKTGSVPCHPINSCHDSLFDDLRVERDKN